MPAPRQFRGPLLAALILMAGGALADGNPFCGSPVHPGDPSDLANAEGDMSLQHVADQPAGMVTCASGYLLAKCGDFATANKVFDKCIAAGYVGSMIWKALMLEDGSGVKQDLAAAARLMHRAATSHDGYAALGKLHYATMLLEGKGVPKNEAEARKWFEAAAAEGNEDAQEYLRTGSHTGDRDQTGRGVGKAYVAPSPATIDAEKAPDSAAEPVRIADREPPAAPPAEADLAGTAGQRLRAVAAGAGQPALPAASLWLGGLLALAFAFGAFRQRAVQRAAGKRS